MILGGRKCIFSDCLTKPTCRCLSMYGFCFILTYESARHTLCPGVWTQRTVARTNALNEVHLSSTGRCVFAHTLDQEWYLLFLCVHIWEWQRAFSAHSEYIFRLYTTHSAVLQNYMTTRAKTVDERACESVLMWLLLKAVMRRFPLLRLERHNSEMLILLCWATPPKMTGLKLPKFTF